MTNVGLYDNDETTAAETARTLLASGWRPESSEDELFLLLALNDEAKLIEKLDDLERNAEFYTHTDRRSFANHILEDTVYERTPYFWPKWATDRAVAILRKNQRDASWLAQ